MPTPPRLLPLSLAGLKQTSPRSSYPIVVTVAMTVAEDVRPSLCSASSRGKNSTLTGRRLNGDIVHQRKRFEIVYRVRSTDRSYFATDRSYFTVQWYLSGVFARQTFSVLVCSVLERCSTDGPACFSFLRPVGLVLPIQLVCTLPGAPFNTAEQAAVAISRDCAPRRPGHRAGPSHALAHAPRDTDCFLI